MNSRDVHAFVGEYPNVLAQAAREGWLSPLVRAHLSACSQETARSILADLDLDVRFPKAHARGRAHLRVRRYWITLPWEPGPRSCRLRIGLVLHEAAHVFALRLERRTDSKARFNHGTTFRVQLRRLLEAHWTGSWREECEIQMTVHNYREIYDRHRGPFWILLTKQVERKPGRFEQTTDKIDGPLSAEEAHEEARVLVNGKNDVLDAHVFSVSEGQFIGAFYARGHAYSTWSQMGVQVLEDHDDGRLELSDERDEAALLPGGPEPVRKMDAPVDGSVPKRALPARRPVRDVPPQAAAQPRAKRALSVLELDPGNAEAWPRGEGARIVRAELEAHGPGTAADLAQRVAADCAKAGIGFPASLVSRLKQGGFLREVGA